MSTRRDAWAGNWLSERVKEHDKVAAIERASTNRFMVLLHAGARYAVGAIAAECVDGKIVSDYIADEGDVSFIINIPPESYIRGDALNLAKSESIVIGGVGDLLRALSQPDPLSYINPEVKHIERVLAQHSRIIGFDRIDDRRYSMSRDGLEDITAVFLDNYEMTADAVRTAIQRYGSFQCIVKANPNGNITSYACAAAESSGRRVWSWTEFMRGLNYKWTEPRFRAI
jgi:hypothetical protein